MTNDAERVSDIVVRLRALIIMDEVGSDNPLGRDAAAIIEAQSKALAEAREVKPLKWREYGLPHDYGNGSWEANGAGGRTYEILDVGIGGKNGNRYYLRGMEQCETLDEAKAIAQADYEATILSALATPTPENLNG